MELISSLVKKILKLLLYLTVFIAAVLLIPNLPPYTQFTSIQLDPTQPRTGALSPNDILNNPEKLYEGKLLGPEAFDVHNGEVYTGLATGEIVKLSPGGHVTFVTKIGRPCAGIHEEEICGRPLGLEIDKKTNQLYVADAYHGIWKVDLKTDKKQLLVSPNVEIDGKRPKIFNSLAVDSNGDVYWTDSSSDFQLKDGAHTIYMDPSGRLFHYNAAKNVSTVLIDKLGFANGVVISSDKQFLLVVESMLLKVTKYYINGPKKGESEVFVTGLPGVPDNMRVLPDGSGVLVALYTVFDDEHPLISKSLAPLPLVRKFLIRTILMIENLFEFLNGQVPHPIFQNIVNNLGTFKGVASLLSGYSGLVQLDWNGKIVASYFSTDRKTSHISDAIVVNDKLWTGSPHTHDFIASYNAPPLLKKAFTTNKPSTEGQTKEKKVEKVQINEKVVEKKEAQKTTPPPVAQKTNKIDDSTKQPPPQSPPPVKSKTISEEKSKRVASTQQPEKKPTVNLKESKEAPKQSVNAKGAPSEAKVKPNKDNIKPTTAMPKESDTKKKIVSETKQKLNEDKAKTNNKQSEKPKSNDNAPEDKATPSKNQQKASPAAPSSAETKKAPEAPKTVEKQIPVVENIPSDTAKPNKQKLNVIKKSGPDVIPNPNL